MIHDMVNMIDCEHRKRCQFLADLSTKLGLAVFFLTHYCEGPRFARCARYLVMSTQSTVPADLYPNQLWRVRSLLTEKLGNESHVFNTLSKEEQPIAETRMPHPEHKQHRTGTPAICLSIQRTDGVEPS